MAEPGDKSNEAIDTDNASVGMSDAAAEALGLDLNNQPPAEGEQPPAEGEQPPVPAEGEQTPETPPEGEQPPAEGETPPPAEETPSEASETPTEGEQPPAEGETPPAPAKADELAEMGIIPEAEAQKAEQSEASGRDEKLIHNSKTIASMRNLLGETAKAFNEEREGINKFKETFRKLAEEYMDDGKELQELERQHRANEIENEEFYKRADALKARRKTQEEFMKKVEDSLPEAKADIQQIHSAVRSGMGTIENAWSLMSPEAQNIVSRYHAETLENQNNNDYYNSFMSHDTVDALLNLPADKLNQGIKIIDTLERHRDRVWKKYEEFNTASPYQRSYMLAQWIQNASQKPGGRVSSPQNKQPSPVDPAAVRREAGTRGVSGKPASTEYKTDTTDAYGNEIKIEVSGLRKAIRERES